MIYLIVLAALLFRIIYLNQSLWLDEAISLLAVKNYSLWDLLTKYIIGDFHPPAYHVVLWFWVKAFGFGEIAARTPSVIFGVLTVYITFLTGKHLFSMKVGLIGALLLAVSPLHVYYSQEARIYALNTLAVCLSFYFFVRLKEEKNWLKIGYILSSVLVLYSGYISYFIFPAQFIYLFVIQKKILLKQVLILITPIFLLIPWLPIFYNQLLVGIDTTKVLGNWSAVVGGATVKNLILVFVKTVIGRISFENKTLYTVISTILAAIYGYIIYRSLKTIDEGKKLLLCWLVIPLLLAFLTSFVIPIFSYFRMLFILPAFYLLVAIGISQLSRIYLKGILILVVFLSLVFLIIFYTNSQYQREDWRKATSSIEKLVDEKSVIMFDDNNLSSPYFYYSTHLVKAVPGLIKVPAKTVEDLVNLEQVLKDKDRVYLFEYLSDITDPQRLLEKKLVLLGFKKTQTFNFNGVGFVNLYAKD